MNGVSSVGNSVLLHSHFQSSCTFASSSSSSSSAFLSSPCFTTSTHISISHRIRQKFRAFAVKRSDGFRLLAVNKRKSGDSGLIESENSIDDDEEEEEDEDEEDWDDFDEEGEEDEDEGEFLPMDKMKKWLEKKPRGFGEGKKYETSLEDKLLDEIEQSWKAQAANLNKLKNSDPLKPQAKGNDNLIKGSGEAQIGFRVRVTNLPKKKNVHRDLKAAFKEVSGVLNIAPAVSGNKKTKDPVCRGFALVDFKTEVDANRFVEQFNGERLSFGKVVKQIKCQVVESSSGQSVSEERLRSDTVFEELPFSVEAVSSSADVVEEEDAFVDSWEESDGSDIEVDETETEVEEDEGNRVSSSVESPVELRRVLKSESGSEKQVVKPETTEHEELETPLVPSRGKESVEEAVAETHPDDVEEVAEENPKPLKRSMLSIEEQRMDRIRKLELKLLGREKLFGGAGSGQPDAKSGSGAEGKKKEKKKKKKVLVKGQAKKGAKIEIPGSSKRLKVKEKALLTGVLVKYAAKAASNSNDE